MEPETVSALQRGLGQRPLHGDQREMMKALDDEETKGIANDVLHEMLSPRKSKASFLPMEGQMQIQRQHQHQPQHQHQHQHQHQEQNHDHEESGHEKESENELEAPDMLISFEDGDLSPSPPRNLFEGNNHMQMRQMMMGSWPNIHSVAAPIARPKSKTQSLSTAPQGVSPESILSVLCDTCLDRLGFVKGSNGHSFSARTTPESNAILGHSMGGIQSLSARTTPEPTAILGHPLGAIGSGLIGSDMNRCNSRSSSVPVGKERNGSGHGVNGHGSHGTGMSSVSISSSASQEIDLSNSTLRYNLSQLANMCEPLPHTSVACSSTSSTPSPQPIASSAVMDNGGVINGEALANNLMALAKLATEERLTSSLSSPTPPGSLASTPLGNSSRGGGKVNIMQIRCKFGQLGSGKGHFSSPHGFCLGVEEEIVIADTNNHRICIFDKSGEFKHHFGIPGKDEGQLWYPRKVAIIRTSASGNALASPRYVICDRGSERSRMQIFTRSGHFIRKIAIRYIDIVAGLAITPNGHIVAVDSVSPTVFVIAESGDLLRWFDCSEHMREPSDIAVNNNEYYICDFKGHCVVVFSEEGQYMRRIGFENLTNFPNGIDISDAGDILVGDSHGNRFHVVVFDKNGTLLSEFECPYVKVSRCCGLKITSEGYVVTLAKNNHHVLILNTLYIM